MLALMAGDKGEGVPPNRRWMLDIVANNSSGVDVDKVQIPLEFRIMCL